VIRKHRLAERLLLDVIGIERRFVHEEACRWEHVMSEQVEERLAVILDDVSTDPFGNPVPPRTAEHPRPSADEVSVASTTGSPEGPTSLTPPALTRSSTWAPAAIAASSSRQRPAAVSSMR